MESRLAILQDADEFLADPGNQEQVSKRLNFNQELKDLKLQGFKKKLAKVPEENGNPKVSNEGLKGTIKVLQGNNAVLSAATANLQATVTQGQEVINSLSGELASRSLLHDSTSERSFADISRANSISSHANKRKSKLKFQVPKLKVPVPKKWNGAKDEEITVFLARMDCISKLTMNLRLLGPQVSYSS